MSIWGALAGGFVGTVVLSVLLETAAEQRLTRIDPAYLLGTLVTGRRVPARAVGYALHFAAGLGFAALYWLGFDALGEASWGLGAAFGAAHGALNAAVFFPCVLPLVHPRLSLRADPARSTVEPPGFLSTAYGPATPAVLVAAYAAYGTLVGGFAALPA